MTRITSYNSCKRDQQVKKAKTPTCCGFTRNSTKQSNDRTYKTPPNNRYYNWNTDTFTATDAHKTAQTRLSLPKCKLDDDPCDGSDGGGVSECPGVWLGRGIPIGLGDEENPRLL